MACGTQQAWQLLHAQAEVGLAAPSSPLPPLPPALPPSLCPSLLHPCSSNAAVTAVKVSASTPRRLQRMAAAVPWAALACLHLCVGSPPASPRPPHRPCGLRDLTLPTHRLLVRALSQATRLGMRWGLLVACGPPLACYRLLLRCLAEPHGLLVQHLFLASITTLGSHFAPCPSPASH